jgi:pimeloyl-ACP methyl ester carboxylesterase
MIDSAATGSFLMDAFLAGKTDVTDGARRYGRRMRRVLIALSITAAVAVCAPPAGAAEVRKGPKGAAFYTPPKHVKGKHGTLIWARRQRGSDALAGASRNTLLLYRSTGIDGKPNAVSGSLALPKGKAPKGGWPLITYAHGTTGSADKCAPTRGYDAGRLTSYAYPLLRRWLKAGYAVVRTDYEGLGTPGVHGYLIGEAEGRSVLDAVRAARGFEPRLSRRFVVAGHSQGGHAALFASSLAPRWVPDLRLRGTVAFAPASHLATQLPAALQIPTPGGGLGAIAALGLRAVETAQPAVGVTALLTPQAAALFGDTTKKCYDELSESDSFGGLPLNQLLIAGVDLAPLAAVLGANDPEHLRIGTPVWVEQGADDGTVFRVFTDQLVDAYTTNGVNVTYEVYDGVDHGGVVTAGAKAATTWIRGRLK